MGEKKKKKKKKVCVRTGRDSGGLFQTIITELQCCCNKSKRGSVLPAALSYPLSNWLERLFFLMQLGVDVFFAEHGPLESVHQRRGGLNVAVYIIHNNAEGASH